MARRGAALPTRCHSACSWSNVAPSTAVRSCGASNTSFIAWRQSLCGCWTTPMEQFTSVRHRLLDTSHLQEISQDLFIQLFFLEHETDYWPCKAPLYRLTFNLIQFCRQSASLVVGWQREIIDVFSRRYCRKLTAKLYHNTNRLRRLARRW